MTISNIHSTSNTQPLQALGEKLKLKRAPFAKQDTIASAAPKGTQTLLTRPTLEKGQSQRPDVLMILGAAFAKIFEANASSSELAAKQLTNQNSDNNIKAKSILDQTNVSITKQQAAIKSYNHEMHREKEKAKKMKILNIVFGVLGAVLIIATIVSGLFDGGASEALVPEEIAMESTAIGAAEGGGEAVGEGATEEITEELTNTVVDNTTDADEVAPPSTEGVEIEEPTIEEEDGIDPQEMQRMFNEDSNEADTESVNSKQQARKFRLRYRGFKKGPGETRLLSRGTRMAVGTVGGMLASTPLIVGGVMSLESSKKYTELSRMQTQAGLASSQQKLMQSYFQVFQDAAKQDGEILQGNSGSSAKTVDTFTQIVSAYKQVAVGIQSATAA